MVTARDIEETAQQVVKVDGLRASRTYARLLAVSNHLVKGGTHDYFDYLTITDEPEPLSLKLWFDGCTKLFSLDEHVRNFSCECGKCVTTVKEVLTDVMDEERIEEVALIISMMLDPFSGSDGLFNLRV